MPLPLPNSELRKATILVSTISLRDSSAMPYRCWISYTVRRAGIPEPTPTPKTWSKKLWSGPTSDFGPSGAYVREVRLRRPPGSVVGRTRQHHRRRHRTPLGLYPSRPVRRGAQDDV
jgi:hypothetical protein